MSQTHQLPSLESLSEEQRQIELLELLGVMTKRANAAEEALAARNKTAAAAAKTASDHVPGCVEAIAATGLVADADREVLATKLASHAGALHVAQQLATLLSQARKEAAHVGLGVTVPSPAAADGLSEADRQWLRNMQLSPT